MCCVCNQLWSSTHSWALRVLWTSSHSPPKLMFLSLHSDWHIIMHYLPIQKRMVVSSKCLLFEVVGMTGSWWPSVANIFNNHCVLYDLGTSLLVWIILVFFWVKVKLAWAHTSFTFALKKARASGQNFRKLPTLLFKLVCIWRIIYHSCAWASWETIMHFKVTMLATTFNCTTSNPFTTYVRHKGRWRHVTHYRLCL